MGVGVGVGTGVGDGVGVGVGILPPVTNVLTVDTVQRLFALELTWKLYVVLADKPVIVILWLVTFADFDEVFLVLDPCFHTSAFEVAGIFVFQVKVAAVVVTLLTATLLITAAGPAAPACSARGDVSRDPLAGNKMAMANNAKAVVLADSAHPFELSLVSIGGTGEEIIYGRKYPWLSGKGDHHTDKNVT